MTTEEHEMIPMAEDTSPAPTEPTSAPAEVEACLPPQPEDVTPRLAADFLTLMQEFPHLISPTDLPDSVLETAAQEGIPLLDAYLRYRWQEEKKVAASVQMRQQAAQRSAGSLSRGAADTPPEQDAFLRAFRSAL